MGFPHKSKWHPASGNFGWFGSTRGSRSAKRARKKIDETIPAVKERKKAVEGFYKGMGDIAGAEKNIGDLSALEDFLSSSYDIKMASDQRISKSNLAKVSDPQMDIKRDSLRTKFELGQESRDLAFQKNELSRGMQQQKDLFAIEDLIRQLEMERSNYG